MHPALSEIQWLTKTLQRSKRIQPERSCEGGITAAGREAAKSVPGISYRAAAERGMVAQKHADREVKQMLGVRLDSLEALPPKGQRLDDEDGGGPMRRKAPTTKDVSSPPRPGPSNNNSSINTNNNNTNNNNNNNSTNNNNTNNNNKNNNNNNDAAPARPLPASAEPGFWEVEAETADIGTVSGQTQLGPKSTPSYCRLLMGAAPQLEEEVAEYLAQLMLEARGPEESEEARADVSETLLANGADASSLEGLWRYLKIKSEMS
ncbi:unnamed protein product [Polarella glacialis]|uniref:Uncharacterized protein n=1 Tax=Polarella glacialis TaxID=89957 RepID=A0A813DPK6_POLGL|nr:unnamed protein product [Polarella glacialis]CAE8646747.1 unnamed protein product [Polarella glacialis]